MFRVNNFDKLLDKATSNLRLDPDWPTILQICDLIRQNDCTPKYAVAAVKKKLYSQNPHQAMFALLTLESIVKNCGSGVHDEVTSKAFCEMLRDLVKTTQHENLRTKILELIQAWAFAFRNSPKYRAVQDTVNILKAEGYKFPTLKESDAMFSADTAPEWADGEVCHRCRVAFSLIVRRHHCRACGQVFCQQCSSKTSTLPKFGIEKEVRVCDACYDKVSRPPTSSAKLDIVDTSSDYGPTQPQTWRPRLGSVGRPQTRWSDDLHKMAGGAGCEKPKINHSGMQLERPMSSSGLLEADDDKRTGGKTAEELQEEEELQLALALSQSEAEHKEKERKSRPHLAPDPTPHHSTVSPTPSSVSASPEHSSQANAELSRYLDRNYWERRVSRDAPAAPTAPAAGSHASNDTSELTDFAKPSTTKAQDDDGQDKEIDEFVETLKSQVEIFVNRMKSNSSRGRSIANDTAVQTLFMNITAMHSRLLKYIQQLDDKRVYLESLQDKVTQIRDSRAALDTLRAEHAARIQAQAEAAERQRQMQMAAKLQAMRKKKHEYLQYQRQLALQRVQEQEREMQMRQEQQKHQYMMSANNFYMPGVSMTQYQPGYASQPIYGNPQFLPQMMPQVTNESSVTMPGQPQISQAPMGVNQMATIAQSMAQLPNTYSMAQTTPANAALTSQSINQPNIRSALGPQISMPGMMLQQMHQMRMPIQAGTHQMMTQNIANGPPGQPLPQQNGQSQLQKQNLPNQPPNSMMPQMSVAQQNMGPQMMNPSNPMMGMQMPNMRMPMLQGNQPNANQQMQGYQMNLPNQHNPQTSQAGTSQQQPMSLPGQMQMPGQQMMQGAQSQQIPQNQGQQMQQPQGQTNQIPAGSMQIHPSPAQMMLPGQQMPPNQNMQQNQMVNQQNQMLNQPQQMQQLQPNANQQMPPGQHMPQMQGMHSLQMQGQLPQQMTQGQPVQQNQQMQPGQQLQQNQQMQQGQQMQPMQQGQSMPQGQPMQGQPIQQNQPMQGQPMPPGQAMPGQAMQQGQPMPQGQPIQQGQPMPQSQPMKVLSNYNNMQQQHPSVVNQQTQQPQTTIKSEHNNNTAELISFD